MRTPSLAALTAVALLPLALAAQEGPLPLGSFTRGEIPYGEGAVYLFDAPGSGFLTVVVRGEDEQDLTLAVYDQDGQALPDGQVDRDMGGRVDAEQMVVTIPRGGRYTVAVESFSGVASAFQLGATFFPAEVAALPEDPDGRPGLAMELAVGASHEDSVSPGDGDAWDWYRIPVTQAGVLTVLTRGEGDLTLEWYEEGSFQQAMDYSDQDMDGALGNESLTLNVGPGDVVFVRVTPLGGGGEPVPYRIASGLIPG